MEEDFELIINDDVYHVKTPELERPSQVNSSSSNNNNNNELERPQQQQQRRLHELSSRGTNRRRVANLPQNTLNI